jgi:Zn-dependent peptidase ImmA (M78 family)
MYGFKVRLIKVNARRLNFVKAKLFRLAGTVENPHQIRSRVDLTPYESRFAVTKELSHLIIDEPEDWCTDGRQIIDELFELYGLEQSNNGTTVPQRKMISENIAEMAAAEFLYPHRFRAADLAALTAKPPTTTMGKLEIRYELPAPIISRALSKWYMAIANVRWQEIQTENNA